MLFKIELNKKILIIFKLVFLKIILIFIEFNKIIDIIIRKYKNSIIIENINIIKIIK